jgi:outer membrane protein insertion porin family/translocation and assembly module TamA
LPNGAPPIPVPIATGGLGLWEASAEVRVEIISKLGAVVFLDSSDVAKQITDMNLSAPHMSTGLGLRYMTPVGPFRLDVGARIPGAQVLGQTCPIYDPGLTPLLANPTSGCGKNGNQYLDQKYGQASSILDLPIAVSLAIGEAF